MSKCKWTPLICINCSGHGLVPIYSYAGREFEGPAECRKCGGTGQIWRSQKGALAQWPGGPFIGRETPLVAAGVRTPDRGGA